ncbi:Chaperone J-domain superfamily [Sesbania bispinosa]|nr:Chaperone J-domain superfamily [Sesbania bispinosa]
MERFYHSQRESILLGYNNNNNNLQIRKTSTNPSTPQRNSDVDFNDVFGGPPRRSSVNETRRSLSGEEGEGGWCAWGGESEKPVFGEENGNRRRYSSKTNDFFDDIFGGEECSTPKKRDSADPFTSTVLSPALEPLASSLPPSFSLPAKLTKGVVDLRTLGSGSPTRSRKALDINDSFAASNGLGSSDSHLSRFSTLGVQRKELKNDLKSSYRQSLLSQEYSPDKADIESNMKQDTSSNSEVSPNTSNGHFHFSIYKWASKGVPLAMPLRTERTSRKKDKVKLDRCSSAKEFMVTEITTQNDSSVTYNGSSFTKNRKQDVSTTSTTTQNGADSHQIVEQIVSAQAQSDTLSNPQTETQKLDSKSLHSLFTESDKKQDNEMTRKERAEIMTKSTKKLSSIFDVTMNPKKQEEKTVSLQDIGNSKATSQDSLSFGENMGKGRGKGKVKEFVRIFNQETVTKPRVDFKSRLQSSTYKQRGDLKTKNDVEDDPEQSKNENSATETTNMSANNLSQQDGISVSAIPDMSFTVVGDKDGSFHGNFTIQVLAQDEGEVLQNQEIQETQVLDNKIQQWSKGKEGNIRSLLSTLQYVLWPECGWKPVPLVDIIEGNAVKRSYQRALLCLHPDKLQQKGAASDQKYIAEKVFDILQEAWTQFNMLGAL